MNTHLISKRRMLELLIDELASFEADPPEEWDDLFMSRHSFQAGFSQCRTKLRMIINEKIKEVS